MDPFHFCIGHGISILRENLGLNLPAVRVLSLLHCPHALVLTEVGPRTLNARNISVVYRLGIGPSYLKEHLSVEELAIENFWFHPLENSVPQLVHLLHKFRPQLLII